MRERHVEIHELRADLNGCLEEVQQGTTLLLTDGEHRVARIVPEPRPIDEEQSGPPILPGKGKLRKFTPRARLRGEGTMADIVRENRQ